MEQLNHILERLNGAGIEYVARTLMESWIAPRFSCSKTTRIG